MHSTTTNLGAVDYFSTVTTAAILSTDTVISLSVVPSVTEGFLVLDPNNSSTREIVYFNSVSGSTVICPDATAGSSRGLGGTSVGAHLIGITVEMRTVAEYINAVETQIAALRPVTGSAISYSTLTGWTRGANTGWNNTSYATAVLGGTISYTATATEKVLVEAVFSYSTNTNGTGFNVQVVADGTSIDSLGGPAINTGVFFPGQIGGTVTLTAGTHTFNFQGCTQGAGTFSTWHAFRITRLANS